MISIHRSNQTEYLAAKLSAFLGRPANPLVPDLVMVHSKGLGRWLEQQIAHHQGICANISFLQPIETVEAVLARVDPDAAPAWTSDRLAWSILSELIQKIDEVAFEDVRAWSMADGAEYAHRRLADLALDLAPRFERYALYRPTTTNDWRASGDWQQSLWSALVDSGGGSPLAQRVSKLCGRLFSGRVPGLPERLAVFCPGSLPPLILELIEAMAVHIEVELFILRPRTLVGHPLLVSLGAQAAAFDRLLTRHFPTAKRHDSFEAPAGQGLLKELQRDMHMGEMEAVTSGSEKTIRLHACGGAQRQVEVLRDVLIEAFEDETLEPRQVLVLTPDIEKYGPLIRAALTLDRGPNAPALPFRLADTSLRTRNTAAAALLDAVELVQGRFEVTAVMDMLGRPEVSAHWGVGPSELETLRALASEAAIHWGCDEEQREELELPRTEAFTWRQGLDRLLMGLATSEQETMLGLTPAGGPRGRFGTVATLVNFVEGLFAFRGELEEHRTPAQWEALHLGLLEHLCGEGEWTVRAVRVVLAELVEAAGGSEQTMPITAFRRMLEGRFSLSEPGQSYLAGGVTVCALVPMRSVPFRVVCLLGMDEGAYPRHSRKPAYDIMSTEIKDGDIDSRQDDRALMLETLMCTRDRLEIFTTSRAPRDGAERPPAVPISELLDVLDESQPEISAAITVTHPLQPYDPQPFTARTSFDPVLRDAARALVQARGAPLPPHRFLDAPLPRPKLDEVPIHRLISGLKHPIKHFCTQSLGIYLEERGAPLEDREPLELERWDKDHLLRWNLKNDVTKALLAGLDPLEELRGRGKVPAGKLGNLLIKRALPSCQELASRVEPLWGKAEPRRVELFFDEAPSGGSPAAPLRLWGNLPIINDRLVSFTPSSLSKRHKIKPWVELLALCAADAAPRQLVLVHRNSNWTVSPIPADEARAHLERLLGVYRAALRTPLMFDPYFSGLDERRKRQWSGDVYQQWVLGGQRLDAGDLQGIQALPGFEYSALIDKIFGGIP